MPTPAYDVPGQMFVTSTPEVFFPSALELIGMCLNDPFDCPRMDVHSRLFS